MKLIADPKNPLLATNTTRKSAACASFALAAMIVFEATGCNGLPGSAPVSTKTAPQKYMAPIVAGDTNGVTSVLQSYSIDDSANTFTQTTYPLSLGGGSQINNAGNISPLARGLLGLSTTYSNQLASGNPGTNYNPPKSGSWAVELSGQAGGFIQLLGQPFTPLVASETCPSSSTPVTYQFLTIPDPLLVPAGGPPTRSQAWNPAVETAYGTVDISATGDTVTLNNIQQHTFPSITGSLGTPGSASPTSVAGVCSPTPYGNTIGVPGQIVLTNPGSGEGVSPSATIGIGSSGLLVESNGVSNSIPYQNALGAGTGAIGLPKPSSAISTSALVSAQYLGFFYGSGIAQASAFSPSGWSSSLASFGFSTTPTSCASVAAGDANLIYGGDFTNNDPSSAAVQSAGGFGNCNYAIDLGTQDSANNGLYPAATIWVGATFGGNKTGKSYSFPAIAIAGQLGGKYALFVLGIDTTGIPNQAQGIYLLQSN